MAEAECSHQEARLGESERDEGCRHEESGPDILERFLGQLCEGQNEIGRNGTLGEETVVPVRV